MSVSVDFRVDIRPYTAYEDPSFPIAAWIAQGGLAGDASGGTVFMFFRFQLDEDAQISELFNLEQISFDVTSATNRDFLLETVNMDTLSQNRRASPQRWQFITEGITTLAEGATELLKGSILPVWLGTPNREEGDAGLRILSANIDLMLYAATLQGYMWGPRAILAPGGPRRPVGGLFGRG